LAFLVDERYVYIDENIYPILSDLQQSLFSRLLNAHRALLELDNAHPSGKENVVGSYIRVARSDPTISDICKHSLGAFADLWPGGLQSAACSDHGSPVRPRSLSIVFSDAYACGDRDNIACTEPGFKIDINTSGSLFIAPDLSGKETPVIGNTKKDLRDILYVFIHELGHYLGLGHIDPRNMSPSNIYDIMLPVYRDAGKQGPACISLAETMMLNSAVDADWPFAVKKCSGLRQPGPERKK
jgi:hypothetical protein